MSNKELRNRTIGTVGVESDSAAGETEFDWPCGQSETFGQECVVDNGPTPSITANPLEIRAEDGSSNPAVNPDTAKKNCNKKHSQRSKSACHSGHATKFVCRSAQSYLKQ